MVCLTSLVAAAADSHNRSSSVTTGVAEADNPMRIWFRTPGKARNQTLPLGNGRLGALLYGDPAVERIDLSEETLWSGSPKRLDRIGGHQHLPEIWKLLDEGDFAAAERLHSGQMLAASDFKRQEMLGELYLRFKDHDEVTDLRRELDLRTSVVRMQYTCRGIRFTREAFVSAVDQVLVVRITADRPSSVNVDVDLRREINASCQVLAGKGDTLTLTGHGDPSETGLKFEARLRAIQVGGTIAPAGDRLEIRGADSVLLLLAAATNFKNATVNGAPPAVSCERWIAAASAREYATMLAEHQAEHASYFSRAALDLGSSSPEQRALPTDERLKRFIKTGERDANLEEQLFQMGRYLLICASRPNTQAATLHGIWPGTYGEAGYNCAYHLDINISENYWPAEVTGLGDCALPLVDLVENLIPNARRTARDVYASRGASCAINVDGWLVTAPRGSTHYATQWVGGMAWISQSVWEHYAFSGDERFLRERAWPVMQEVALFFLDYNRTDPVSGKVYIGPSGSPENGFRHNDKRVTEDYGISMDQELAHEVFRNSLAAAKVLGIDNAFTREVAAMLPKLALPRIDSDGRLLEWRTPREEADPSHRHLSHLYGFHPGNRILLDDAPAEASAVRKSLLGRLNVNGRGTDAEPGTGGIVWQRGWLLSMWARMREPETFYRTLQDFMRRTTEPNLCNKWGSRPYVLDGNGAFSGGVPEALLQSHAGQIHLLPCLPDAWQTGSFRGFRARGGITVDARWTPQSVDISLTANRDTTVDLRLGQHVEKLELKKGKPRRVSLRR